jgi:DNA-binding NarL/FixJ family response regulator
MLHPVRALERGDPMKEIRILIIEDNRFLREGIAALLSGQPDMKVILAAADFEHAEPALFDCRGGVVLLDVSLIHENSLRVTESLSRELSGAVIIVMDALSVQKEIDEFVKAGADGFVNKDATPEDFLKVIRAVAGGAQVIPDRLPGSLFSSIVEHAAQSGTFRLHKAEVKISRRERTIIELVGKGMNNRDIARKLKISPGEIQRHTESILNKLALRKVLLSGGP